MLVDKILTQNISIWCFAPILVPLVGRCIFDTETEHIYFLNNILKVFIICMLYRELW